MELLKLIKNLSFSGRQTRDNDFFSDRLCHRHTRFIIYMLIAITALKRLMSSPLNCWIPAELRRYEKYINKYCWVRGTYYVKDFYELENIQYVERHESILRYYQWVHLILLIQSTMFYFPRIVWIFLSNRILQYDLFETVDAGM